MEEEVNTINTFNGIFQGASIGGHPDALNFVWTRGDGDDPIQTLTVTIVGIDEKDVTTTIE